MQMQKSFKHDHQATDAYYMEQTLIPAQLVNFFFYNFRARVRLPQAAKEDGVNDITKSGKGYTRVLSKEYWDHELTGTVEESWDTMGDDDNLSALDDFEEITYTAKQPKEGVPKGLGYAIVEVDIQIRSTSMSINDTESFVFPSKVRDAVVIPRNEHSREEELLMISLQNSQVYIIRIELTNEKFVPLVVSKQSLNYGDNSIPTEEIGKWNYAHESGRIVATAAFSRLLRFELLDDQHGGNPSIVSSINTPIKGLLLSSCFLRKVDENHSLFLSLICSLNDILQLELREVYFEDKIVDIKNHGPILLDNQFEIPYFMIPLKKSNAVLFIQETKCTVKGINYLSCHEAKDQAEIALPTDKTGNLLVEAYCFPLSPIHDFGYEEYTDPDFEVDQVVMCGNNALWLLDVMFNTRKTEWSLRFTKLFSGMGHCISVLIDSRVDNDTTLQVKFANENGLCKLLYLERAAQSGFKLIQIQDMTRSRSSIPIFDSKVIPDSNSVDCSVSEKVWCIGKLNKSGALMNLRYGYSAGKKSFASGFRKADKVFKYEYDRRQYFLMSFSYQSLLISLDYAQIFDNEDKDDLEAEDVLEDDNLFYFYNYYHSEPTILFQGLQNGKFVHVLGSHWKIGSVDDLDNVQSFILPPSWKITLASCYKNFILLAYDKNESGNLEVGLDVFEIKESSQGMIETVSYPVFHCINNINPSLIQLFDIDGKLQLVIGSLDENDSTDRLYFFHLNENELLFEQRDCKATGFENCFLYDFQAIRVEGDLTRLLFSTKDGAYFTVLVSASHLFIEKLVKVSSSPLEIIKTNNPLVFYFAAKGLWKVDFSRSYYPTKVYVKESTERDFACATFLYSECDSFTDQPISDTLICVRNDGLCHLTVDQHTSLSVKQVSLGSTPLHFLYLESCDSFAVIVSAREEAQNQRSIVEGTELNQGDGQEDEGDQKSTDVRFEPIQFYDQSTRKRLNIFYNSQAKYDCTFKKDEFPITLLEMIVNDPSPGSEKRRLLAVGCSVLKNNKSQGRLKIYEFKKSSDFIKLRLVYSESSDAPVLAMSYHNESSLLMYASGFKVRSLYLRVDMLPNLHPSTEYLTFQSTVIGITPSKEDDSIVISTAEDSFYRYKIGQTDVMHCDELSRFTMGTCLVQNDHVIVSEKRRNTISVIKSDRKAWQPIPMNIQKKVPFIPRLTECDLSPTWQVPHQRKKFIANGITGEFRLYTSITQLEYESLSGIKQELKDEGCLYSCGYIEKENHIINCDFLKQSGAMKYQSRHGVNIDELVSGWSI